jgi:TRAP-type mannitol/chloroaromatic compound transport system permease small subunit
MTLLLQTVAAVPVDQITNTISGNISWLLIGIVLFIAAAIVIYFLKNIVANTVLGLIGWATVTYFFHISLPFWPSLLVSGIFGLAGLGAMVVLSALGIVT